MMCLLRSAIFALLVQFFVPHAVATALPDFTALVERHGAAVVNISAVASHGVSSRSVPQIEEDDPMFDFFRRFIPRPPRAPDEIPGNESLGSGFIISADGYILTNAHVVEDAEEILVRLADKREYRARVIGADIRSDVALIRIEASGLPRVTLGDPARLKVGEWVLAIGSPFGFEQTVTAGIVSAKERSLPDENFVPFIQTDVAINPGNSGGPLFNLKGEVIGINSQIYSRTGGFMGLSFAIPIDVAMDIQHQLRSHGRIQRGRIGVAIQEVTRDLAESFGLPRASGALVSSVEADSPAARAGVARGDVIVSFGDREVDKSSDLPRIVAASRPGAKVTMAVYRGAVQQALTVTLGEWQDPTAARAIKVKAKAQSANPLGLTLVKPALAKGRGAEQGLVVDRAEGPAARATLQSGDLVLALILSGKQLPLDSVETFNKILAEIKEGQQLSLLVQRGSATSFVGLRAGR